MLRVAYKLLLLLLGVLVVMPLGMVVAWCKKPWLSGKLAQLYFRYAAWVVGLRVWVHGKPSAVRPLMLVSNHISYLDILVLGSCLPVIFTPKSEIAGWPVIGRLCTLMGCVFIERKRQKTKGNIGVLEEGFSRGLPVVLFAEGTTSDSKRILPIRSSYFKLAEDAGKHGQMMFIQPVLIRYKHISGLPMDIDSRHKIAWYGDMELVPHAGELFRQGSITAEVVFLPLLEVTKDMDRKAIASACERALREAFS